MERSGISNRRGTISDAFVLMVALILPIQSLNAGEKADVSLGCYCIERVGNVDCDYQDKVSLGDISLLVDHLFINHAQLPNLDEANINGDPEGVIDMGDVALLVDHLFIAGHELPWCPKPPNAPPTTILAGIIPGWPYINSLGPEIPDGGVPVQWYAEDLVDHPYYPPPFEFEYRVYGPYTDSVHAQILDEFSAEVFLRPDGTMYRFGLPPDTIGFDTIWLDEYTFDTVAIILATHFVVCDTSWDGGVRDVTCDTIIIDTLEGFNEYGRVDTLLDIGAHGFGSNPEFNRIALQSSDGGDAWTFETETTLYDLFGENPSDSTCLRNFIFWVRSRDPIDSNIYDPTPAFASAVVIEPKFERDIFIIHTSPSATPNRLIPDSAAAFWGEAIQDWIESRGPGSDVQFDPATEFVRNLTGYSDGYKMLLAALRHKVVIVTQDGASSGAWNAPGDFGAAVFRALSRGTNFWYAGRVPVASAYSLASPSMVEFTSAEYQHFFGAVRYVFPGWGAGLGNGSDGYGYGYPRVEDLVGASSSLPTDWPELVIDTRLLKTRYDWLGSVEPLRRPFYPWMGDLGALPQVGYMVPVPEAEVMYRYVSKYGDVHPIFPERMFNHQPVMHRLDRGLFRTVHGNFTPLAFETESAQAMINAVLDWLYDHNPTLTGGEAATATEVRLRTQELLMQLRTRQAELNGDGLSGMEQGGIE